MKIQLPDDIPSVVITQANNFWNVNRPGGYASLVTDDLDNFVEEVQKLNGLDTDNEDVKEMADNFGLDYWDIVRKVVEGCNHTLVKL